jgi:hypothetical protein
MALGSTVKATTTSSLTLPRQPSYAVLAGSIGAGIVAVAALFLVLRGGATASPGPAVPASAPAIAGPQAVLPVFTMPKAPPAEADDADAATAPTRPTIGAAHVAPRPGPPAPPPARAPASAATTAAIPAPAKAPASTVTPPPAPPASTENHALDGR